MRRLFLAVAFVILSVDGPSKADSNSLGNDPKTFDQRIDTADLTHNVAFLAANVANDAIFTHDAGRLIWNKQQWLEAARTSKFLARNVDSVEVERHGDVVETIGHIQVKTTSAENPEYQVYFVRLYSRQSGTWQFLSHRTISLVQGPLPPFVGTWELNLSKSKFPTGQVPQRETLKCLDRPNGFKIAFEGTDFNGEAYHIEWSGQYDGRDYVHKGNPSVDTAAMKRIDPNTLEVVDKKAGKEVGWYRSMVSKDGKIETITGKIKDTTGQETTVVMVYEKQ